MSDSIKVETSKAELKEFLMLAVTKLKWSRHGDQMIIDVGCGDGTNSTVAIQNMFPMARKIIGLDIASDLVQLARDNLESNQIIFFTANIQQEVTLSIWEGHMQRIVCIDCLNWLDDAMNGFLGIKSLLCSGGSAAVLMTNCSPFQECLEELLATDEWKHTKLAKPSIYPRFPLQKPSMEELKYKLQDIGFEVVYCEEYSRIYHFRNINDFHVKGNDFLIPLYNDIEENLRVKFRDSFLNTFMKLHGLGENNSPMLKVRTNAFFIRKL